MATPEFTDEDLMAYADGQLPEERASALDLALSQDPSLAERLALFVETSAAAKEALAPMLDEPVPDELVANVRALAEKSKPSATVTPFPPRPANSPAAPSRSFWQVPLAAGLALIVGFGAAQFTGAGDTVDGELILAGLGSPEVIGALTSVASGEETTLTGGERFAAIATFEDGAGALCREYELDRTTGETLVSVACHDGSDWSLRLAIAASSDSTGYAPASSLDTLDAYLTATEAGAPMSLEDEAAALARF